MSEISKETIVVLGYGWIGQANALALSQMGYEVSYFDIVEPTYKYADMYANEYENITKLGNVLEVDSPHTWYLICVGDRVPENGIQDISLIVRASETLRNAKGGVILRSTVLPQNLDKIRFDYYLPEFLHEKKAVEECINPFYFVVGVNSSKNEPKFFSDWKGRSYKSFLGSPKQASYIKYLSNAWNATRIAFVNEFGDIMEEPNSEKNVRQIEEVLDFVLGRKNYLKYGKGYGGHCLPKDMHALFTVHQNSKNVAILKGAHLSNLAHLELQKKYSLPEWYSIWVTDDAIAGAGGSRIKALWFKFNSTPSIQSKRRRLRFITNFLQSVFPDRNLRAEAKIWNKLATKNARYYVNPKTKSGEDVNEYELRDSGLVDYEKFIKNDPIINKVFANTKNVVVAHIGCGIGRMTEFIATNFKEVHALDISSKMIEQAQKRLGGFRNITYTVTDGVSLPYKNENFDFVFSYQVMQHLPNINVLKKYMADTFRTLKKGGIAKLHLRTGRGVYKWSKFYGVSMTKEEAIKLAEEAGFKVLACEDDKPKNIWLTLQK